MSAEITPAIQQTIHRLAARQMALPALLFLAGHRPLAFLAGQLAALGAPLTGLLGIRAGHEWAALLSHPEGPGLLEALLRTEIER